MAYVCNWMPDWSDMPVAIIASGPSAAQTNLAVLKNCAKVIVVNNSWRLYPEADLLFACDYQWWKAHDGVPSFHGLKVTSDNRVFQRWPRGICYAKRIHGLDEILTEQKGVIGWGGNSGFQALNIAVQTGTKKIVLVGFDMRIDLGVHWHGAHQGKLTNPITSHVDRWRRALDKAYATLSKLGISAYNCSPVSHLAAYPKVSLEQALDLPHYNRLRSEVGWRVQTRTRLDLAKKCAAIPG